MKKILITFLLLITNIALIACPVCEKQQPQLLKGITHGAGPESNWDYLIVWAIADIVLISLFFSVKYLIRPGETQETHIKHTVINFE
jgi:hypothetical protein